MNKTYRVLALFLLLSLVPLAIHLHNNSNKQIDKELQYILRLQMLLTSFHLKKNFFNK